MADVRLRWLVAAAAAFNFLFFLPVRAFDPLGPDYAAIVIMPILIGGVFGEIGAAALWLVWGEGAFLRRLAVHWTVGFLLVTALLLGLVVMNPDRSDRRFSEALIGSLVIICVLPSLSLAAQLPLWLLRIYFGWLVERPTDRIDFASHPLSIRDLLSGTAVVAATLGLARALLVADPIRFAAENLVIPAVACFGMALCVGIPVILCILKPESLKAGIIVLSGYLLLGVPLVVGTLSAVFGAQIWMLVVMLIGMLIGAFAMAATLAAPLLVLRVCGYRLSRPRDRPAKIAVAEPA